MIQRHGITMGMERLGDEIILSFKAVGKLTDEDYKTITPLIDRFLEGVKEPKVKMLFDAREFEGWELKAAWDDFKIGLKHGNEFAKVAIVGAPKWLEVLAKLSGWFMSGEIKTFENMQEALEWLHS